MSITTDCVTVHTTAFTSLTLGVEHAYIKDIKEVIVAEVTPQYRAITDYMEVTHPNLPPECVLKLFQIITEIIITDYIDNTCGVVVSDDPYTAIEAVLEEIEYSVHQDINTIEDVNLDSITVMVSKVMSMYNEHPPWGDSPLAELRVPMKWVVSAHSLLIHIGMITWNGNVWNE
ncbi:MAG: hypothetical protein Q9M19_01040 [Mariprofundaceae bacterium]|nr:hypothetical protein [Mariprofundaceae bacterium]